MSFDVIGDLLVRWFHIMAGIMWIGNSMLYNWLDRNLVKRPEHEELSAGDIWLLHSGAFYHVEKKLLEPGKMPDKVHWFMWQNFSTWASGILLLIVVYYLGERAWLVDPQAGHLAYGHAVMASIFTLIFGVAAYEVLWRSKLQNHVMLLNVILGALLIAITIGLTQIMTPRAAYIHIGVLIGSCMTANVWFVIVPSQRDLVAATRSGKPQDKTLSLKAKARSVHNNYLTFPLIFIMVSNHFPIFYSHRLNWLILLVLMAGGAAVRHFMNIRWTYRHWRPALVASALAALGLMFYLVSLPASSLADNAKLAEGPPVYFDQAQAVISLRCVPCHSTEPSDKLFKAPPGGLMLDSPAQIKSSARRLSIRVMSATMPFRNRTQMTDEERVLIGRWVAQGATLKIAPPEAEPVDEAAASDAGATQSASDAGAKQRDAAPAP